MTFRLTRWLSSARRFFSARTSSNTLHLSLALLASIIGTATVGCAGRKENLRRGLDRSAAKISFISWNMRAKVVEPRESAQSRAFRIASLSNRQLYQLMETRPAPDLATISGKWNGINKGVGSAMMGLMQDVKVLEGDGCVTGYNILVKQVSIKDLPCRGWQPERDPKTCKPKAMGNFIAVAPTCCGKLGHTVKLDYTIAENPWYDPSRFLIDELVAIDDDLLLGRATAKIGSMQIPVAYFVLSRAPQCDCHRETDNSVQPSNQLGGEVPEHSVMGPSPLREIVDREILAEQAPKTFEVNVEEQKLQSDDDRSASDKPIVYDSEESLLID